MSREGNERNSDVECAVCVSGDEFEKAGDRDVTDWDLAGTIIPERKSLGDG